MRKPFALFLIALATGLGGCSQPAEPQREPVKSATPQMSSTPQNSSSPAPSAVQMFRDDGSGNRGEAVESFQPGDRKMHFLAKLDEFKVGKTKAKVVFTGVETSAGKNLAVTQVESTSMVANEVTASVTLPRDWPFGSYKADFYIDDKLVTSRPYVISPAIDELKTLGLTLLEDDGKGNPGKPVKFFKATQHKLHFALEVNGFLVGKAKASWRFVAVDTTKGKNVDVGVQDADVSNIQGNTLTSFLELPRDWPTGTYKVEVKLNEREIYSGPFEIKS